MKKKNNDEAIMFEPFELEHAINNAEAHLEMNLGITSDHKDYEKEMKIHIQKVLEESFYESKTPGRMKSNPTSPKVSKLTTEKIHLLATDGGYASKHVGSEHSEKVSRQIRSAVMSLVDILLKTKFSYEYADNYDYKKDMSNDEKMQLEKYRLIRVSLTTLLAGYLEGLFDSPATDKNVLVNNLENTLKNANINTLKKIKSSELRDTYAMSAYNVGKAIGFKK